MEKGQRELKALYLRRNHVLCASGKEPAKKEKQQMRPRTNNGRSRFLKAPSQGTGGGRKAPLQATRAPSLAGGLQEASGGLWAPHT